MSAHTSRALALAALLHAALAAPAARAEDAASPDPGRYRLRAPFGDPDRVAPDQPEQRNLLLGLGEVFAVNFVMWQGSYWMGKPYAKISTDSIADNFNKGWIIDTDAFWTNQFGHPYEGASFYTAMRSTGSGAYTAFAGTFLGSLLWESFAETQSPSVNDQITTPFGGSVLGEVLYRMFRLISDSGGAAPGFWRSLGAFAVSPVSGFNRLTLGNRYDGPALLPSSWMGEFHFGAVLGGKAEDLRTGASTTRPGPWASFGAHVLYGVPGDPALRLRRPFDHFDLRASFALTKQPEPAATLLVRGVLYGDTLESGESALGLWGLFTSYDVICVPTFKAAGFGVGPGVALGHRWGAFELHGTVLAELLPWAGGGSVEKLYQRDYHYGPGAAAVTDLRLLFGNRLILDLGAREYFISGAYATQHSEDITWTSGALTARVVGPHALTASAAWSRRHASYPMNPDLSQRGSVVSVHYTLLGGW